MAERAKSDRFDWIELETLERADDQTATSLPDRPTDAPSFLAAARRMRRAGHFGAATTFYKRAVGLDRGNYAARVELIDTLVRSRHLDEAAALSQQALEQYPRVRVFYASQALVLTHQAKLAAANEPLQIALEGREASWYEHCVHAEVLLHADRENRIRSKELIEDAAHTAGEQWEPYFLGGWMFLDARLPAIAAGFFAEAAHLDPRVPLVWLCLGDCFRELRLYDQALFYYERVVELDRNHEIALERQKLCKPRLFGLMRAFDRRSLRARWKEAFDKQFVSRKPR